MSQCEFFRVQKSHNASFELSRCDTSFIPLQGAARGVSGARPRAAGGGRGGPAGHTTAFDHLAVHQRVTGRRRKSHQGRVPGNAGSRCCSPVGPQAWLLTNRLSLRRVS